MIQTQLKRGGGDKFGGEPKLEEEPKSAGNTKTQGASIHIYFASPAGGAIIFSVNHNGPP